MDKKVNPYKEAWRSFKGKNVNINRNGEVIHRNVLVDEVDVNNQAVMFSTNGRAGFIKLSAGIEILEVQEII